MSYALENGQYQLLDYIRCYELGVRWSSDRGGSQIHHRDNVLKGRYDAFSAVVCCCSRVRGVGVDGMEIEGEGGPATALEVAASNEGLFCVCG